MHLDPVVTLKPLFAERRAYIGVAANLSDLASATTWPPGHFILLLLADTRAWPGPDAVRWAEAMIRAGVAYACCWGPDCDRMHECFDEAGLYIEHTLGHTLPVIMTTDHRGDSLDEALWFAASSTWPAEEYAVDCHSLVVLAVGEESWAAAARRFLEAGAPLPSEA